MIISASRRTDIPAFYSRWLMRRIEAGFCLVSNPFNPARISRISLAPEDVDAMVLWSKNPYPMFQYLNELDKRGYRYYFLLTLNDYPGEFEPNLPGIDRRISDFVRLSDRIGPRRAVWRYDPVIISSLTPFEYHEERFERLCRLLAGHAERVIVSVVDFYRKTERRLGALQTKGVRIDRCDVDRPEMLTLLSRMSAAASSHGIEARSCAEARDLSDVGIRPGSCIDGELIEQLGVSVRSAKDPGQRPHCRCVVSRDIGVNHTCLHGCVYCYATSGDEQAHQRYLEHNPDSPILWSA